MPNADEIKKEASYLRNTFEKNHLLTPSMNHTVATSMQQLEDETELAMETARNQLIWTCDCKQEWDGETCSSTVFFVCSIFHLIVFDCF